MHRWTVGLVLLLLTGCASSGSGAASTPDRNLISRAELEASSATNVYELVQLRRPNWLRTRGTQSFREQNHAVGEQDTRNPSVVRGETTIVTYLDGARLGDVTELRRVSVAEIRSVRFLDAAAATQRWGGGHSHGAILLSTNE
jgi:hypothetical protein